METMDKSKKFNGRIYQQESMMKYQKFKNKSKAF